MWRDGRREGGIEGGRDGRRGGEGGKRGGVCVWVWGRIVRREGRDGGTEERGGGGVGPPAHASSYPPFVREGREGWPHVYTAYTAMYMRGGGEKRERGEEVIRTERGEADGGQ